MAIDTHTWNAYREAGRGVPPDANVTASRLAAARQPMMQSSISAPSTPARSTAALTRIRRESGARRAVEGALIGTTDGGAGGGDDEGVTHRMGKALKMKVRPSQSAVSVRFVAAVDFDSGRCSGQDMTGCALVERGKDEAAANTRTAPYRAPGSEPCRSRS